MLTHHPNEMGWASAKPADIAAFGLKEGFDMDRDLEEQPSEYEIWILNEDFCDCVDFIHKEAFFKGSATRDNNDNNSSGSSTALSPALKGPPCGRAKRDEEDSDDSKEDDDTSSPSPRGKAKTSHFGNDDDSDNQEDAGICVTADEMKLVSPSKAGKPRWTRCFCCSKGPFPSPSLIIFDYKVFHSEHCLAKFKADLVHPRPCGPEVKSCNSNFNDLLISS